MKNVIYFSILVLLSFPAYSAQKWEIVEAPEGSGAQWMASVSNKQGDTLGIWRKIVRIKFEAIGELVLSGAKLPKNAEIEYSIDGGQAVGLDVIEQKGNLIIWRVWSSTTNEIFDNDSLWYMARGNEMTVSWKDEGGNIHKHALTLSGSAKALERIISGSYR